MTPEARAKLIETTSAIVIVVCGIALAIPMWIAMQRRDDAQRILNDVELVREAVYRFYSDSAAFPPEAPGGQFSDELAFYLPPTFNRTRPYGTIEYRNWVLRPPVTDTTQVVADTTASAPPAPNVIALAIVPRDPKIAAAASALAYAMPQFTMGNKFFFVLFGS